ncbi:MAG TPA: M20/M25/M40 family metallo-hydrolase [Holophagaceae bacterium]|nr:M20/M25/M40 family metallo-hydrolase [Holophagaceae bacterium]
MRRITLALPFLALGLLAGDPSEAILAQRDPAAMMADLTHLTEAIGPRLTGSARDHEAHAWALRRFRELGLATHREAFPLAQTWHRGPASARLLGDHPREVRVAQWGWTPGTRGPVTGPLVVVKDPRAVDGMKERLRGAIVLLGEPAEELDPMMMRPPLRLPEPPHHGGGFPAEIVAAKLKAAGALAILRDAGKSGEHLNMASPDPLDAVPLPAAFVPHGAYADLVAAEGARLSLRLEGDFGPAGRSFNTVAELKGSSKPDEVVLLGAHLDSWDLGTGATDNGSGAMAVLEAARILSGLKERPARTIRFVLFGGEEQGYLGSEAYAKVHQAELPRFSGVFVMDTGAGAIDAWALQGRAQVAKVLEPELAPLKAIGVTETDLRNEADTDFEPFDHAGVPAFCAEQKQHGYAVDHHGETDTLDKVIPAELKQASVVLAYTAWRVAQLPALLPRER